MARVTQYRTLLTEDGRCELAKERAVNYPREEKFDHPQKIYRMLCDIFQHDKQSEEFLYLLCFNSKMKLLGVFEVSHGDACTTICNNREIFQKALLCNASCIVLAHNHPSGDVTPSEVDVITQNKVKQASEIMGVLLKDNLIVGNKDWYSFAERQI